ncbi:hypothetical protein P280DRAFT_534636 [Massarina eburnea CBS 473.64]|uniref:Uncharacterized protein n=1 Tax=Massarina eburnea CBS 473.64 TaxID=1395130 RepID=A0A6A6RL10_9PLEO|nr:hypothetical protein P280DRAFT_534636 [Massarina eburnea CBS 473.64]
MCPPHPSPAPAPAIFQCLSSSSTDKMTYSEEAWAMFPKASDPAGQQNDMSASSCSITSGNDSGGESGDLELSEDLAGLLDVLDIANVSSGTPTLQPKGSLDYYSRNAQEIKDMIFKNVIEEGYVNAAQCLHGSTYSAMANYCRVSKAFGEDVGKFFATNVLFILQPGPSLGENNNDDKSLTPSLYYPKLSTSRFIKSVDFYGYSPFAGYGSLLYAENPEKHSMWTGKKFKPETWRFLLRLISGQMGFYNLETIRVFFPLQEWHVKSMRNAFTGWKLRMKTPDEGYIVVLIDDNNWYTDLEYMIDAWELEHPGQKINLDRFELKHRNDMDSQLRLAGATADALTANTTRTAVTAPLIRDVDTDTFYDDMFYESEASGGDIDS